VVVAAQQPPEPRARPPLALQQQEPEQPARALPAPAEALVEAWAEAQPRPETGLRADAPRHRRAWPQPELERRSHPKVDGLRLARRAAWPRWQGQTPGEPIQSAAPGAAEVRSGEVQAVVQPADAELALQGPAGPNRAKTGWLAARPCSLPDWQQAEPQAGALPAEPRWPQLNSQVQQ
jgi:hypothetical protein